MRLPESQIKEAILHPDLDVRDVAIRYFYSSTVRDYSLMPLAIKAIEKYGKTEAFSHTHYLNVLPQTEQTIAWVIAELRYDFQCAADKRYFYFLNLSRLLCRADIRIVAQCASEILHAPHFDPKEGAAFRERLEMSEWKAEKCWEALRAFCHENQNKSSFEEFDLGHALRLVEALARQSQNYQEQILAILAEKVHDFRHDSLKWLRPMLAKLAGEIRLQTAISSLVGYLGHPHSFLSDQCLFALAKIGTDEVVAAVCDHFPHASRDYRRYASDLLCKIHLDSTVIRVLELLPGEADLVVRINLCEALLDHFSSDGVEPARQLVRQNALTPDLRHLRSTLITTCKITGARFPEFDEWQKTATNDALVEKEKLREFQILIHEAKGDLGLVAKTLRAKLPLPPSREPNRRTIGNGKLGRNDLCRCGSGKKYKVCCMRK